MARERDVPDPVDSDVLGTCVSIALDEESRRVPVTRRTCLSWTVLSLWK